MFIGWVIYLRYLHLKFLSFDLNFKLRHSYWRSVYPSDLNLMFLSLDLNL